MYVSYRWLGRHLDLSDIEPARLADDLTLRTAEVEGVERFAPEPGVEDWVLEIDNKSITHRPDLWGHRGIAAELAAIYERRLAPLDCSLPPTLNAPPVALGVESPACSRYLALAIDGARPLRSPDWLRWLLLAVGQTPIDQIVDLSNFVMFDLGQPNHAFDAERLEPRGIVVRSARAGERLITLEGAEKELAPPDLVVCAGEEVVALAGVVGGQATRVNEATRRVLLEVATFEAAMVRRTAARHGVRTESSMRFEKGLDPSLPARAAGRFARMLRDLQPGVSFHRAIAEAGDGRAPERRILLRPDRVRQALGIRIEDEEVEAILSRLGFETERQAAGLAVQVPAARAVKDIVIEQDLIEEIGRLDGYRNVPPQTMRADVVPPLPNPRRHLVRRIQDRLAGAARFHEVINYSFVPDSLLGKIEASGTPHVRVVNPVDKSVSAVRRSVLSSLLGCLEGGRRHRDELRLFEIGKGYLPERSNERGEPEEVHLLALAWARGDSPRARAFRGSRFDALYTVLVDLIEALELEPAVWERPKSPPQWAHPVRCLEARWPGLDGAAAIIADLEPKLTRELGLDEDLASEVVVAEVSIDRLLEAPARPTRYRPIPRYPGIKLDIAVEVSASTPAADVSAAIERAGAGAIEAAELFDLYTGTALPLNCKSLAYHVVLQSRESTLTDRDQAEFLRKLEHELESISARLRKQP